MTAGISTLLLDRLVSDALRSTAEICGLLLGPEDLINGSIAAENVASEPARQFEIAPAILIAALRDERAGARRLAGYYHSHPAGDPTPSATDAAMADPDGRLWLIIGGSTLGLWRAVPDGAHLHRFEPVPFRLRSDGGLRAAHAFSTRPGEPHIRSFGP